MSSRDRCRARVSARTLAILDLVALIAAFVLTLNILATLIEIRRFESPVHALTRLISMVVAGVVGVVIGVREARKRVAMLRECRSTDLPQR
jgi:hypothetical protein